MTSLVGTPFTVTGDATGGIQSELVDIPAGATTAIIGMGYWRDASAQTIINVALDGQNAVKAASYEAVSPNNNKISMWRVSGFSTGSGKTLAWENENAFQDGVPIIIFWLKDENTVDPQRDADAATGGGSNSSAQVTLDTVAGDLIITFGVCDDGPTGYGSGQTEVVEPIPGFNVQLMGATTEIASGTSDTQQVQGDFPTIASIAIKPAEGGGAVEETPDPDAFNWTEQAVNANEALPVAPSTSWGWTGQGINLAVIEAVPASTSWDWTGQSPNVNAAVIEAVGVASWSFTGQELSAIQDLVQQIVAGAWNWTGQSLISGIAETIAESTEWAWTGQAVFVEPRQLLGTGSFSFSGQSLNVQQSQVLPANTGWDWSGQAVNLTFTEAVPAAILSWTGQDLEVVATSGEEIEASTSWSWEGQEFIAFSGTLEEVDNDTWAWSAQALTDIQETNISPNAALFRWAGKSLDVSGEGGGGNISRDIIDTLRVKLMFELTDIDRDYPVNS